LIVSLARLDHLVAGGVMLSVGRRHVPDFLLTPMSQDQSGEALQTVEQMLPLTQDEVTPFQRARVTVTLEWLMTASMSAPLKIAVALLTSGSDMRDETSRGVDPLPLIGREEIISLEQLVVNTTNQSPGNAERPEPSVLSQDLPPQTFTDPPSWV
ncbi:unnamed protein product, partial [Pleuronectes platessa]